MKLYRVLIALLVVATAAITNAQSFPPAFSKTATYTAGDIVQYGGNWYRAMKALTANGPYPASAYGYWELNYVRSNTTLTIGAGQGFGNLLYAWTFASNARIAGSAYLHFSIVTTSGKFSETFNSALNLDHDSGTLISINGDITANITLNFPNSAGLTIDGGHSIAHIGNLQIVGAGDADSSRDGISISNNASIEELESVNIEGFDLAIDATQNASILLDPSCNIESCYGGINADLGSTVNAAGGVGFSSITTSGTVLNADHNSTIIVRGTQIENTSGSAVGTAAWAQNGAVIDISGCTVKDFYYGSDAYAAGHIVASNTTNSNTIDFYASDGGTIHAINASTTGAVSVTSGDGSYLWTT